MSRPGCMCVSKILCVSSTSSSNVIYLSYITTAIISSVKNNTTRCSGRLCTTVPHCVTEVPKVLCVVKTCNRHIIHYIHIGTSCVATTKYSSVTLPRIYKTRHIHAHYFFNIGSTYAHEFLNVSIID